MSYSQQEKIRAVAWKNSTQTLPLHAKVPAGYVRDGVEGARPVDYCLPPAYSGLSLLPDVRDLAIGLFVQFGIPWHEGVAQAPSNHLLDSQVQCVNALGQMVRDPDRVKRAFGDLLGIADVLEIEPGRFLTFEYIGPTDFFGESPGKPRVRGTRCTSVDAAFLHRDLHGVVELVLVEWKYTESYKLRKPDPARDKVRRKRYAEAVADPAGPIHGLLDFDLLLDEPFYQLVRQQLLAHALEATGAEGASRVRLVHVSPHGNAEYQQSIARAEHKALGSSVSEIWAKLLRHPDRFLSLGSEVFLDPEITSREYGLRYAEDVIYDEQALFAYFDVEDADALDDTLQFDGDVLVHPDGVEYYLAGHSIGLNYPFRVGDLAEADADLVAEVG